MSQPAAKLGDKVQGVDIHIIMIPSPGGPIPTPLPHLFAGTILQGTSNDVMIEKKPAATVDSIAINMPPHIPQGGSFMKPPSNQGKIMMGSLTVLINGKPAARMGDMVQDCNDPVDAPTGTVIATSTVLIGGPPSPVGINVPVTSVTDPQFNAAVIGVLGSSKPAAATASGTGAQRGSVKAISNPQWDKQEVGYSDPVKLMIDTMNLKTGTSVIFEVWKRLSGKEEKVTDLTGRVDTNKASVEWRRESSQERVSLQEGNEFEVGVKAPIYFFIAKAEGMEVRSGPLILLQDVDIYLEDEEGTPLDGVDFSMTLPDGSLRQGRFKQGHGKLEKIPPGKLKIEVDGYSFLDL